MKIYQKKIIISVNQLTKCVDKKIDETFCLQNCVVFCINEVVLTCGGKENWVQKLRNKGAQLIEGERKVSVSWHICQEGL